jgi:hypothetical protein
MSQFSVFSESHQQGFPKYFEPDFSFPTQSSLDFRANLLTDIGDYQLAFEWREKIGILLTFGKE